tara:strand:- start:868 stop:1515 length:648 start_codon:yes stop_codon:yes gene_type:complete
MTEFREELGWQVVVHPEDAQLHIDTPQDTARANVSFVQYFGNQAWSMERGLDKSHTVNWRGKTYFTLGDRNSIVIKRGEKDSVWIDPVVDGPPAPIEWSILTSYQNMGEPARFKRCQYIRPQFITDALPSFSVAARYDFDIREEGAAPPLPVLQNGIWDITNWDASIWGGTLERVDNVSGARGMGRNIAIAMRGTSVSRTILVAFDVIADSGGWM